MHPDIMLRIAADRAAEGRAAAAASRLAREVGDAARPPAAEADRAPRRMLALRLLPGRAAAR